MRKARIPAFVLAEALTEDFVSGRRPVATDVSRVRQKGPRIAMRAVSRLPLLAITVFILAPAQAGLAWGNTLYVKKSGSDWATSCTAADPCLTIKHAVSVANSGDTIQVGAGVFAEDNGVVIDKNLTINGSFWLGTDVKLGLYDPGAEGCCPVFEIENGAAVTLRAMSISGGAGSWGAGISNNGTLTLRGVAVSDNQGRAGIVNWSWASLTTANVAIVHNTPIGLWNQGAANLVDTRITGSYGVAWYGGVVNSGTLTVDRGLFAGNEGPGIEVDSPAGLGPTTTDLTNVTISGNSNGGVAATNTVGRMKLKHVTIAANTVPNTPYPREAGLFAILTEGDQIELFNSIVATNGGGKQCGLYKSGTAGIVRVEVSHSLLGDDSCTRLAFPDPSNLVGVDPKLGALEYRGVTGTARLFLIGATKVMPLLPGSPAIDSAGEAFCVPYDQLGNPRGGDGNGDGKTGCDMGAYEVQPTGATTDQPR